MGLIHGAPELQRTGKTKMLKKSLSSGIGDGMPEIDNLQETVQHCFELARWSKLLEEDIALEAFELLTANDHDQILEHALGVSL
jgi:hypothetical protein